MFLLTLARCTGILTIEAGLAGTVAGGVFGILRSSQHVKTFSVLTGVNCFTLGWTYWGAYGHCQTPDDAVEMGKRSTSGSL